MSEDFDSDDDDEPQELPRVAASESDLLVMARALVAGPDAQDDVWSLLCAGRTLPPRIGTTCAGLLEDTLAQVWRALWQRGGTRPRASVQRDGTTVRGRLWERYPVTPLQFTAATVQLLRWLVSQSFAAAPSTIAELKAMPLAIGDQIMIYLALDAARATPAARVIAAQPLVAGAPLAWLGFAPLFAAHRHPAPQSFASLVESAGAIAVEALADELAQRWYQAELAKRQIEDPAELIALGAAQDTVLERFMAACDAGRRRDLARFVLDAAAPLLARNLSPHVVALDPRRPLSERAQARIAAGALMRAINRWNDWDQLHRGVRYIDDDYQAAQLMLQYFERIGPPGVARAQGWVADLASLAPGAAATNLELPDEAGPPPDRMLVARLIEVCERADVDDLIALLHPQARLEGSSARGHQHIVAELEGLVLEAMRKGRARVVPTGDFHNRRGIAIYKQNATGAFALESILLLGMRDDRIVAISRRILPAYFELFGVAAAL